MTAAEYLDKLKSEKDYWQKELDALPSDTVSVNNPIYKMSVNASNKYAAAKTMMQLMAREAANSNPT